MTKNEFRLDVASRVMAVLYTPDESIDPQDIDAKRMAKVAAEAADALVDAMGFNEPSRPIPMPGAGAQRRRP